MNSIQPTHYWRNTKTWSRWIGQTGTVVVSTFIRVAAPELSEYTPYSFVVVNFGSERHSFMGVDHEVFQPGDQVRCVVRKGAMPTAEGVIPYAIKVEKIAQ